jgi:hypothetical protein
MPNRRLFVLTSRCFVLQDTSSVAAITILPSATELVTAWKTWYAASKHLSRLRFIRRRIIELGHSPAGQKLRDYMLDDQTRKFAQILGAGGNDNISAEVWKSLGLGPEQVAQYNLEYSQVSTKRFSSQ